MLTTAFRALEPLAASDLKVLAQFLKHLDDQNEDVRRFCIQSHCSPSPPPMQKSASKSSNASTIIIEMCARFCIQRSRDLRCLRCRSPRSNPQTPRRPEMQDVRLSVFSALASLAATDAEVREQILKRLDDQNEDVRDSAVSALAPLVSLRHRKSAT